MLSEEKYYNKIMKQDKMSLEEAENTIDDMYQDKYKVIEENGIIYTDRLNNVKFTNLEFASVRMLREVQSLRRKLEKQQKENEELENKTQIISPLYVKENYIPKQKIKDKIELLKKLKLKNVKKDFDTVYKDGYFSGGIDCLENLL